MSTLSLNWYPKSDICMKQKLREMQVSKFTKLNSICIAVFSSVSLLYLMTFDMIVASLLTYAFLTQTQPSTCLQSHFPIHCIYMACNSSLLCPSKPLLALSLKVVSMKWYLEIQSNDNYSRHLKEGFLQGCKQVVARKWCSHKFNRACNLFTSQICWFQRANTDWDVHNQAENVRITSASWACCSDKFWRFRQ